MLTTDRPQQTRPRFEVADVLREHWADYRARYVTTDEQRKAASAMLLCRTAALGGHVDECSTCGYARPSYNSCRHRACPKCQGQRQEEWIARQVDRALPVAYSHVVFTLPAVLRPLAQANPREVYRILFAAASRTVLRFGQDARFLGAQVGVTAVLHTWSRSLHYHPHAHLIVTAGGLSKDGSRWVSSRFGPGFLFPVKALARAFRASVVRALGLARKRGRLRFQGRCQPLAGPDAWELLKRELYAKEWIVYAKRPFPGARQLYRYLGRYTHRVGLSNDRIERCERDAVTIRTRGEGRVTFHPLEFLRRFLQHVPPAGFVRVRHYGLFASAHRDRLCAAQALLSQDAQEEPKPDAEEGPEALAAPCPACLFGELERTELDPLPGPPRRPWDP